MEVQIRGAWVTAGEKDRDREQLNLVAEVWHMTGEEAQEAVSAVGGDWVRDRNLWWD